jgi:DNA-binding transcriptional MerR regulator
MKEINGKQYYKMSELSRESGISNHTIAFYNKKGLIPNGINTSKNMKYYPTITLTVLNLIKYLKENLNFSIDYINELFTYYSVDFEDKEDFIIQVIEMITYEITEPVQKEKIDKTLLLEAISLELLEDKANYFKTEMEVLNIFSELKQYDISYSLIKEYIKTAKKLAVLERELSDKVYAQTGHIPETLVLDILNKLKPFIFNQSTIMEYKNV